MSNVKVVFNNEHGNEFDKEKLTKIIARILAGEKISRKCEVSVSFVSESEMRKINKDYRKIDKETDVVSLSNFTNVTEINDFPGKDILLGDIFLCPQEIKHNAREYNINYEDELENNTAHGILHLLGYDHKNPKDLFNMISLQKKYIGAE